MKRSAEEVRAGAALIGRARVLRWLTRRAKEEGERSLAHYGSTERSLLAASAKAAVLADLVDEFVNGRER